MAASSLPEQEPQGGSKRSALQGVSRVPGCLSCGIPWAHVSLPLRVVLIAHCPNSAGTCFVQHLHSWKQQCACA